MCDRKLTINKLVYRNFNGIELSNKSVLIYLFEKQNGGC